MRNAADRCRAGRIIVVLGIENYTCNIEQFFGEEEVGGRGRGGGGGFISGLHVFPYRRPCNPSVLYDYIILWCGVVSCSFIYLCPPHAQRRLGACGDRDRRGWQAGVVTLIQYFMNYVYVSCV